MTEKKKDALWIYISHQDGKIDDVSLELLGKGQKLAELSNKALEAVIIGSSVKKLAEKVLNYGAETVYYSENKSCDVYSSVIYTHILYKLVSKYKPNILLFGSNFDNEALASRVAVNCGTGLSAHCVDLKFDGPNLVQTVPGFGGNFLANIICPNQQPQMATVAAGVFEKHELKVKGAHLVREKITIPRDLAVAKEVKRLVEEQSEEENISNADIVVAGGFGVGSANNWKMVEELASVLGGSVGATRPPVDEGWAKPEQMIGASGKMIKPALYIGIGISGMMHHVIGLQGSGKVIAINNDPTAPIFSIADYGIVGDLNEVLPLLIKKMQAGESLEPKLLPIGYTRTPQAYKESISAMRSNIYKFGTLIKDPVTDARTRRTVAGHAQIFEAAHNPRYQEKTTTISSLSGQRISRYLSIIRTPEDMFANSKLKRLMYNLTGTCTGGRCAGWNAINAMWSTTWEMDRDLKTDYHERLKTWLMSAQKRDITLSGALTDPKGHRKLPPSRQIDPDMYLHVIEKRKDGIVVRGAKIMICGTAAANEIFIMPGTGLRSGDADYAVSFTMPRDTEGVTIVETRHASDRRALEEGFDNPVMKGGITQAFIFFEDVFIPKERVFMCGEYSYSGDAVTRFTLPYRAAIGGCVAGQGDVMVGASILIARANGLPEKTFRDKLVRMIINNETTFGLGLAASVMGTQHPSGCWIPDPVLANVNKVHVATLPYETKRLTQEIAGGIGETGCLPSYQDFIDSRYGHLIQKYLKANSPAETRFRIARLIEWLTLGSGVPGCMHGGGSPDGARMAVFAQSTMDEFVEMSKRIADISDISLT